MGTLFFFCVFLQNSNSSIYRNNILFTMRPVLFLFIACCSQVACFAQKKIVVIDEESKDPIDNVLVMSTGANRDILGNTSSAGEFVLPDTVTLTNITLFRTGYYSLSTRLTAASCDTFKLRIKADLGVVVVKGNKPLVTYKADRFVYNVDADSSALNEMAIETLRKVPTIMVNRKGEISSDFEKNIVFKLNGLNDPLIANPQNVLNALPNI